MSIYCVSNDLKTPGQQYTCLHEELEKSTEWCHFLDSTWLIYTTENAEQIFNRLKKHIDENDYILIIEVTKDRQGWLPQEAWKWIDRHLSAYAF